MPDQPDQKDIAADQNRPWGRSLSDLWLEGRAGELYQAERDLLTCASRGELCIVGPERPATPNDKNRIRADLLRFIALGGDAQNPLHEHGVDLEGAFIECPAGELDFSGATLPENLGLFNCMIDGDINLRDALVKSLNFNGCTVNAIFADRLNSTGTIQLRHGFKASGTVRLLGAKIGGVLDCSKAEFNGEENALHCDGMQTRGNVFLCDGFKAHSTVRLSGAKIGGDLSCSNAEFNGKKNALHCDSMQTRGSVVLRDGFKASGTVRLLGTKIGGDLACRDGVFLHARHGLITERAVIDGNVFLDDGFLSLAPVDLSDTTIHGNLRCNGGTFSNKEKSLHAPRATVHGSVFLGRECRVAGTVSFQAATIDGNMTFVGGSFEGRSAVDLRNAAIKGMLFWRDIVHARGELVLSGATCLSLNMDDSSWSKPARIRLDNFVYRRFAELPENCDSTFWINWLERQPEKYLTTRYRPNPYSQLATVLADMGLEDEARDIRMARKDRQRLFSYKYDSRPKGFWPGLLRGLNNVWGLVQKKTTGYGYRPGITFFWLLGLIFIGAGIYEFAARRGIMTPTHPLIFKEAVWKLADGEMPAGKIPVACRKNWVYPAGDIEAVCQASVASEYSTFNALVYSVDVAIPVVNFRMESDWSPRVVDWQSGQGDQLGWWVRTWEWLQIGLGWLFSLLFVSALGGIIKRD